ncbi:ABC transporter [Bacillus mycoides]|nr:ABC transporter [Bacillus mycoides]
MRERDKMKLAIQTKNLTKSFANQSIVRDINLSVPEGSLYAFIGPNGAGKTTTMRMLLGLIPSDEGTILFDNKDIKEWKEELFENVGCFIDSPTYYPNLTAYENLAYVQKMINKPLDEIDRVLKTTGIYKAKDKKVKDFSLGMKQRLGISFAILNDPKILILDEPTNGLDPEGVHEIRRLLLHLVKNEGKTIFISSHNLAEIEMIADHIALLHKGTILYEGNLNSIITSREYIVHVNDTTATERILNTEGIPYSIEKEGVFKLIIDQDSVPNLTRILIKNDIDIFEVSPKKLTLEEVFLTLTKQKELL